MKSILSLVMAGLLIAANCSLIHADDCCPSCGVKICKPTVEKTTEKKSCYEVEQKDVCIPLVNFPWKKCDPPRCGQVRTVNVLKKVDKECESCGYKWEITTVSGDSRCATCVGSKLRHGKLLGLRKNPNVAADCATGDCASARYFHSAPQPRYPFEPSSKVEPVKPSAPAKPAADDSATIKRTRHIQTTPPRRPVLFIPAGSGR